MRAYDDGWLRVAEVAAGIWRIDELYIEPACRGLIWVVEGSRRRLIFDGGWGLIPLDRRLPWLFDRELLGVVSHSHFDHIGAMHLFDAVICHPLEVATLTDPDPVAVQILPFLQEHQPLRADPTDGFQPEFYRIRPARDLLPKADGDVLDLGDRQLQIIATPGHAPGHIALFEVATGALFSADAIYELPMIDDIPGACRETLLNTHARLAELPVTHVFPGHYEVFDGARMRLLMAHYARGDQRCVP